MIEIPEIEGREYIIDCYENDFFPIKAILVKIRENTLIWRLTKSLAKSKVSWEETVSRRLNTWNSDWTAKFADEASAANTLFGSKEAK